MPPKKTKKKVKQCEYLYVCEKVREFCRQVHHCHKKCDLANHIKNKSGKSFCGTFEQVTNKKTGNYHTRHHGQREIKKHHIDFAQNGLRVNKLWLSLPDDFKDDCRRYAKIAFQKSRNDRISFSCRNVFYKALAKDKNQISDIKKLSDVFGNTLSEWIKRGYLENVSNKEIFEAQIIPE